MSVTDELLANNERYAANFDKGELPLPPAKKVAVLACMDTRVDLFPMLGLERGWEFRELPTAQRTAGLRTFGAIGLLGGTVIVESVFAMPGLGSLAVEAALRKDLPVIQGVVALFTIIVIVVNLLVDLTYSLLNPRLRAR